MDNSTVATFHRRRDAMCKGCGAPFLARHNAQVHCSATCRNRWARERSKASGRRAARAAATNARRREATRTRTANCAVCDQEFQQTRSDRCYCSPLCARRAYAARRKVDGRQQANDAEARARRAEIRRRERAEIGALRARYPESFAAAEARRAERKASGERIPPIEVFERDGWICQLCSDEIDRTLSYPDPNSPSLDHVVPLAAGGKHVRSNVQAAHLLCNLRKGARQMDVAS